LSTGWTLTYQLGRAIMGTQPLDNRAIPRSGDAGECRDDRVG
jgi:hypothetical protein